MTKVGRAIHLLTLSFFFISIVSGQSVVPASGGKASGNNGSAVYTAGQVFYHINLGIAGSEAQGVQQPFEISIVTATGDAENIVLEYMVYPNPTRGLLTLAISPSNYEKMRFHLLAYDGTLLQDKKIEGGSTIISTEGLPNAIYLLEVIQNNWKVKVFKIIKN